MAKVNFMDIVDYIFNNKEMYENVSDKDKIDNFFIINRKFGIKYPMVAQFLNRKETDKASALDFWFMYFRDVYSPPGWYWSKSPGNKTKKPKLSKSDKELVMKYCDIDDESNLDFLYEHYKEDIEYELKKAKRF